MDTTPEPSSPLEEFVKRAERLASGAEHHIPSWLRPGDPESRLPVLFALVAVIGLQLGIPKSYTVVPRWPLIGLELLLLAVLTWLNPLRLTNATRLGRYATWGLLAAITLDNTLSGAAGHPHPLRRGQQQGRGVVRQRRGNLRHQHHRVRHLVLGTGPRRTLRPARRRTALPGLHVPADGSRHRQTRQTGSGGPRSSITCTSA